MQKEEIIKVTLDLIQQKEDASQVNLRSVARVLGCAHTNIYNYFDDFDQLLWAALDNAAGQLFGEVTAAVKTPDPQTTRISRFFFSYIHFYMQHKGWFRLFWAHPLKLPRPAESENYGREGIHQLVALFHESIQEDLRISLRQDQAYHILHVVHCYIYGEISIFISGRGLIREEKNFTKNLLQESLNLTHLLLSQQANLKK